MQHPPIWIEIFPTPAALDDDSTLASLDQGERAAIILAESIRADLLLIDDRTGASAAQQRGLAVTGTLGVLDLASRSGLLSVRSTFLRLRNTNFRYPPSLMEKLIEEERIRGK
jgi:predicted nucleic acid-binding protein